MTSRRRMVRTLREAGYDLDNLAEMTDAQVARAYRKAIKQWKGN